MCYRISFLGPEMEQEVLHRVTNMHFSKDAFNATSTKKALGRAEVAFSVLGLFFAHLLLLIQKPFWKTNFKLSKVYTSLIKRGYFLSEYLYSSCCVIARCLWSTLNYLEAGCWVFLLVCLFFAFSLFYGLYCCHGQPGR